MSHGGIENCAHEGELELKAGDCDRVRQRNWVLRQSFLFRRCLHLSFTLASSQPEVDNVVAWSDKARLTPNTSKFETVCTVQEQP